MSDDRSGPATLLGFAMAIAAAAVAAHPAAAVTPAEDSAQWLGRMDADELILTSSSGKALMATFFTPRFPGNEPCLAAKDMEKVSAAGSFVKINRICAYVPPHVREPDVLIGITRHDDRDIRIVSVALRQSMPQIGWRCRLAEKAGWHICVSKNVDSGGDTTITAFWNGLLRSEGAIGSPDAAERLNRLLEDAVSHDPS